MSEQEPQNKSALPEEKMVASVEEAPSSILVSVEELVPDIKPKKESKSLAPEESDFSSSPAGDVYAERLPSQIRDAFAEYGARRNFILKNGFHGQIVVDLGAGNLYGYLAALSGGAKGYIGVDLFHDMSSKFQDSERIEREKRSHRLAGAVSVPAAFEREDMLSFLRRLPDNSVSIISSGHVSLIENRDYIYAMQKEMDRVLSTEGFLIWNWGVTPSDATEAQVYDSGADMGIFVKKDSERYREYVSEWEEFTKKVDSVSDRDLLSKMREQAEREGRDGKHVGYIGRRIYKLRHGHDLTDKPDL